MESRTPRPFGVARALLSTALLTIPLACGPGRLAVLGPLGDPVAVAAEASEASRLPAPHRIDFRWQLNESGSRVRGAGVARVEPPYRGRLDLFLDNGETVIAAALVDDELRVPPGAPEDVLPPVELMWATLGVFRPLASAELIGGDRLEDGSRRLRYDVPGGAEELHFEVDGSSLRAVEVVESASVTEWVRVEAGEGEPFPTSVTYRNLVDFRELRIERTSFEEAEPFDPGIWDPRSR